MFGKLSGMRSVVDTMQESTAQQLLADIHESVALCPQ